MKSTDKEECKPKQEDGNGVKDNRRSELMGMLLDVIHNSENLPSHVRSSFVTYLDLEGALALVYAILKESQG